MPFENNCPQCRSPLAYRNGKYGAFWGCTGYPNCKYIRKSGAKSQSFTRKAVTPIPYTPIVRSRYQSDVVAAFVSGVREMNAGKTPRGVLVGAGPGSGKTTLITELMAEITNHFRHPQRALITCFARNILGTLEGKAAGVLEWAGINSPSVRHDSENRSPLTVVSMNAAGFRIVRDAVPGCQVDDKKLSRLWNLHNQPLSDDEQLPWSLFAHVSKTIDMLYGHLYRADLERIEEVQERYGIDVPADVYNDYVMAVQQFYSQCISDRKNITLSEQCSFPSLLKLRPTQQYDVVIVDEYQDTSDAQQALLRMLLKPNGLFVAVGDRKQGIFNWRCASPFTMQKALTTYNARELPLPVCYRCPSSHVDILNPLIRHMNNSFPDYAEPELEAGNRNAGEVIDFADENETVVWLKEHLDDYPEKEGRPRAIAQSRTCKEMASFAKVCLRNGVPASIRGDDIKARFIFFIEMLQARERRLSLEQFLAELKEWTANEQARLGAKTSQSASEAAARHGDMYETIVTLAEGQVSLESFENHLHDMTSVEKGVVCCTTYRCKGDESPINLLLQCEAWDKVWGNDIVAQIERVNVTFVAASRGQNVLGFVGRRPGLIGVGAEEIAADVETAMTPEPAPEPPAKPKRGRPRKKS